MARAYATQEQDPATRSSGGPRADTDGTRLMVDRRPVTARDLGPTGLAQLQRLAGNAATRLLVQRLCVEDEARGGTPGRGSAGVELPPPVGAAGGTAGGTAGPAPAPGAGSPAPGAAPEHRTLRRGSRGDDVVDLQNRLNAAGAADPALATDGIFGRLTRAAVVEYQSTHDLDPDGVVGPLTWASLDAGGGGGGGGGVEPPQPETDPQAGIVTIVGHDASAAAIARARTQAIELYGGIAPANRARMEADPIWIDVIPHDRKLTELPEYAHLAGTTTFDGRIWDDVRGIQTEVGGHRRVAVAEEDLVSIAGTPASYGSGFLEAHEGGHGLQFSGLTATQQATLVTIYTARLAASGPVTQATPAGAATAMWLNPAWYSAANKEEYFANSVAAYHGHPYTDGAADVAMYTRSWLQTNDAPMFQLLEAVYHQGATP